MTVDAADGDGGPAASAAIAQIAVATRKADKRLVRVIGLLPPMVPPIPRLGEAAPEDRVPGQVVNTRRICDIPPLRQADEAP